MLMKRTTRTNCCRENQSWNSKHLSLVIICFTPINMQNTYKIENNNSHIAQKAYLRDMPGMCPFYCLSMDILKCNSFQFLINFDTLQQSTFIKKKQQVESCFFDQSQTICSGCAYKADDSYIPNGTLLNVLTVYRSKSDHRKTV